jgi:PAS domain S-box-containing protein
MCGGIQVPMTKKMDKKENTFSSLLNQDTISADAHRKKNELLMALFDYSVKLSHVPFSENLYIVAAHELKRIFGAFGVTISTYNAETSELILQYSTFSEYQRNKAIKLIGHNLEGMRFKVSKDLYASMTSEWVKTVSTLHETTFGAISPVIGKMVEKTFQLEWFSGISLQDKNMLIGTAVIIGKKRTKPPGIEELKGFAGVTATALGRWLTEQKVLASEMRFKSMTENMKDVLWQSDTSEKLTYLSPSGLKILGYKQEEILNRSFSDLISPESFASISDAVKLRQKQAVKNQPMESVTYEIEVIHRNGNRLWAEIVSNPIFDPLGNVTGFQGVARDISDRKTAEIKIKQQFEALKQLNAEKDKFFSIIAHDLKGALHGFLGYSKYMDDRIHSLSMDKLQDYSNTIRTIALNLNELLENLLEWSMMQRNRIPYAPEEFDFNVILENSIRSIEQQARNKEITIIRNISPDLKVFVDYQMITSIIRNLVSNAVKFTYRKGQVEILAGENTNYFIEIMIRDNGVGMDENTCNKLFRIDSVMPTPGTEGESSTGLGLIICCEYISKHQGKIWIKSEIDKGTCVHFTLPVRKLKGSGV